MFFFYIWFFFDSDSERRKKKRAYLARVNKGELNASLMLGSLCRKSGDRFGAKHFYHHIINATGEYAADAGNNLGNMYYEENNLSKALEIYQIAAKNGSIKAKRNVGYVCEQQGDYKVAISWYKVAAEGGHAEAASRLKKLQSRPMPRGGMNFRLAEIVAQEWMFYFGFHDARTTKISGDDGLDVESTEAVAQVKYRTAKTGSPAIRDLAGAAVPGRKKSLFFSYSGYTKSAIAFANQPDVAMALFICDNRGVPAPVNMEAKKYFQ